MMIKNRIILVALIALLCVTFLPIMYLQADPDSPPTQPSQQTVPEAPVFDVQGGLGAGDTINSPLSSGDMIGLTGGNDGFSQINNKLDFDGAGKKEKLPDRSTTFGDKTVEVDKDLDGDGDYEHTEKTYPDGTTEVRDTKLIDDGMGVETQTEKTYPDGRTEKTSETVTDSQTDKKTEKTWPDGTTQTETTKHGAGEKYDQSESVTETKSPDGKTQTVTVQKSSDSDPGDTTVVTIFPDGTTQKDTHNSSSSSTETTYPDGTTSSESKVGSLDNGTTTTKDRDGTTKVEQRSGDGDVEKTTTTFPDGTKKVSTIGLKTSHQETTYPDGTTVKGQSIRDLDGKDAAHGTTKTFPDGRTETIIEHANGGTSISRTGTDGKSSDSYLPPSGSGERKDWVDPNQPSTIAQDLKDIGKAAKKVLLLD